MSSVALAYRTLSGSAEVPAIGAAFFLPRQPANSVAARTAIQIVRLYFTFYLIARAPSRARTLSLLCQRPAGHLLHRSDCLSGVWGVKDGSSGNQNFSAGSNQISHIFRADSPIHFDAKRLIISLPTQF